MIGFGDVAREVECLRQVRVKLVSPNLITCVSSHLHRRGCESETSGKCHCDDSIRETGQQASHR